MHKLRPHLSYANVMVTALTFVVLGGGGAYAASHLSKNSVGTKQIKAGAVTLGKINSAAQSTLKGQTGPPGANGTNGTNGATNLIIRNATGTGSTSASCNPGEHPTGGGAIDNTGGALKSSLPNVGLDGTTPNGSWTAVPVTGTDSVTVRVVCASP